VKTLGLIGGTTWHSTIEYYRGLNEGVAARLGGLSSARLLLYSVNFAEMLPPSDPAEWAGIAGKLGDIAERLEGAGAEGLLLCANTPHAIADQIVARVHIPLVHIVDATADAIAAQGLTRVALLGTRPTMELPFFKDRLAARGITALVPPVSDRAYMHENILGELGRGVFTPDTRARYLAIVDELVGRGAQGVILGCTEIPILLRGVPCPVPTFDTLALHVDAAVRFALDDTLAPRE
jgi:aspartate racemase